MPTTTHANCTDCCGGPVCLTPTDVPTFNLDVESDCATMDCPDIELNGSGDDWAASVPHSCFIQIEPPGMTCVDGVFHVRATVPMCVSVDLEGTVVSDPGDPVVIAFPPVAFSGNGLCCTPGPYSVSATATEA